MHIYIMVRLINSKQEANLLILNECNINIAHKENVSHVFVVRRNGFIRLINNLDCILGNDRYENVNVIIKSQETGTNVK